MQMSRQDGRTRPDADRPLTAAIDIAAPPSTVWAVVSDLRRTGDWSPECRRVLPLGPVRRGCWLLGYNRRGQVRWATLSGVVSYQPGQEISWRVLTNRSVWSYHLDPTPAGTRLVETRHTPRGVSAFAGWFTRRYLGGQDRHDDELEAGMAAGLGRIKAIVETTCDNGHP